MDKLAKGQLDLSSQTMLWRVYIHMSVCIMNAWVSTSHPSSFTSLMLSVLDSSPSVDRLLPTGRRHDLGISHLTTADKRDILHHMLTLLAVLVSCAHPINHCGQRSGVKLLENRSRPYWMGNKMNMYTKEAERNCRRKSDFIKRVKWTYVHNSSSIQNPMRDQNFQNPLCYG